MRQDQILLSTFSFDELNSRSIPEARRSEIDRWLLSNPDNWRVTDKQVDLEHSTQYAIIVRGEEGTGKTTALQMFREELLRMPDALPLWLDFTACTELDFDAALPEFIRKELQSNIRTQGLFMEYRVSLVRMQLQHDFHSFYDLQHEARGDFSGWSDDRILTDMRIRTACAIFESLKPNAAHLTALKAAQMLSRRPYLLVDNSDLLGRMRVQKIARAISGGLSADTYLIATTRPENHVAWARGANERRNLTTLNLHSDSQRLFKIARRRLEAAIAYAEGHETKLLVTELRQTAERLETAFQDIERDHSATRLVSDWHNRSVRQMLPSLVATASAYAQRTHAESLHGVVFRTLVKHAMPESLVDIYTPDYPVTRGHEYFVFLKLRILAYLYKHRKEEEPPTLERLKSDFYNAFGVSGHDTGNAIYEMAERDEERDRLRDNPSGGLLRLEELEKDSSVVSVILLSAGICMIEEVITSCDFLSWVYDRSRLVNEVPTAGKTISQVKINKAVEVTRAHILPLFLLEHPYMEVGLQYFEGGRPTQRAAARLARYRTMFGYYSGHWFIASLRDALKKYADDRPDRVTDRVELDAVVETCSRYIKKLDAVARAIPQSTSSRAH